MKVITNTSAIVQKTVNDLVDFVKPTYGVDGKKVIISKPYETIAIDDGVRIANEYDSDNEAERAVLRIIKQVSNKTNQRVGDGTTSSLLLLQGIINGVYQTQYANYRLIEAELVKAKEEAIKQLRDSAINVDTVEDLRKVANISFNNDKVAQIIAETIFKIGKEGVITVEPSQTPDITSEIVDGQEVNTGYISPYFITDFKRMEAITTNASVFITTGKLTTMQQVKEILDRSGKNVLIIADSIEGEALEMCVLNKVKAGFNIVGLSIKNRETLEDIATITGADIFTGGKLNEAVFGNVSKVISTKDKTLIIGSPSVKEAINNKIEELREQVKISKPHDKERIEKRLARFLNGIARINVGANTDSERVALLHKIEDAVNATKVAQLGGVVQGGGMALNFIKTSSKILNEAMRMPYKQLVDNSGVHPFLKENEAYNYVTKETGHFMDVGVIDPVEVLIAGIESAVSIANTLITTQGLIYEEEPTKQ